MQMNQTETGRRAIYWTPSPVFLRYPPKLWSERRQNVSAIPMILILHILTEGKLASFESSAVNDVRMTSCFAGFVKNKCVQATLKIEPVGFQQKMKNERVS